MLPDLSHHNKVSSWVEIKENCSFVILKATQGLTFIDPTLFTRITQCEKHGIPYWVYTFLDNGREKEQAQFMVDTCKNKVGKFFQGYVLDIESQNSAHNVRVALEWLQSAVDKCMIYTMYSQYGLYKNVIQGRADNCAWWEARYGNNTGEYLGASYPCHEGVDLHQFTSKGSCPGVIGESDLSKVVGKKNLDWFTEKAVSNMAVRVGSARIDENGKAHGGKAGDQTGNEVATENWYRHKQGWVVIRAKNDVVREKIAQDMQWACDNRNIGYDQWQNQTLWQVASKVGYNCSRVGTPCETDCARLVRVCVSYAVGKAVPDFYTASETAVLRGTGYFDILTASKYCDSSDYLLRGDILVTKGQGHTVVVLSNGAKVGGSTSAESNIKAFKVFLNRNYPSYVRKANGGVLLAENATWTKTTRNAALTVWKYMANKYYKGGLTIGNLNFLAKSKSVAAKMTTAETKKHLTLAKILQGMLAGKGYYTGAIDGIIGPATVDAIKKLQKTSGDITADTWSALFN